MKFNGRTETTRLLFLQLTQLFVVEYDYMFRQALILGEKSLKIFLSELIIETPAIHQFEPIVGLGLLPRLPF